MNTEFDEWLDEALPKSKLKPKKEVKRNVNHEANIINEVLNRLGKPENFWQATAKNVFDNRWRVNIWTWEWLDLECSITKKRMIEHSYFVKYNEETYQIINSSPEIERVYN